MPLAALPVCLGDFDRVFGNVPDKLFAAKPDTANDIAILEYMCSTIKSHNPNMTKHEEQFLDC
jgi:hypothetical protein